MPSNSEGPVAAESAGDASLRALFCVPNFPLLDAAAASFAEAPKESAASEPFALAAPPLLLAPAAAAAAALFAEALREEGVAPFFFGVWLAAAAAAAAAAGGGLDVGGGISPSLQLKQKSKRAEQQ